MSKEKTQVKTLTGKIVSAKMQKTIVVEVINITRHPLYRKPVKKSRHYSAHSEIEGLKEGDYVQIKETKPISKTKRFIVVNKI